MRPKKKKEIGRDEKVVKEGENGKGEN